ncbi:hypothetical protein FGIG_01156 [Fasciola gigantica]|uniref:Uncharacterized protein n=1 Tax=Fasciola gigantica TaxID=46835 RepID=A0A504YPB7_FASGI|nr:hypothetical protein FGIG_01156 [Fasciola gigantica]
MGSFRFQIVTVILLCLFLSSSNHIWARECIHHCHKRLAICNQYCLDMNVGVTCQTKCVKGYEKCTTTRCGLNDRY